MMQTGAFLQFIVTLTAIVSRLDALAQELREPLTSWRGSLRSLISVMKVVISSSLGRAIVDTFVPG